MPHLVATTLTGAAMVALLPTGTAFACPPPGHEHKAPGTVLRLTVTHPDTTTSSTRMVTLRCDPAGGTHPKAAQACADLARSGGAITRDQGDTLCTMEYAPVVAEAVGHWRGRVVKFKETFSNDCVLRARTGAVFDF